MAGLAVGLLLAISSAGAAPLNYELSAKQIAPDTYVLIGAMEYFSRRNGGNIVNTAFVVTDGGVVVIDTGPSKRYGEALRAAINAVTDKPIIKTFNTHSHPDHFLGNQAFVGGPIAALPETIAVIETTGSVLAEGMYAMVGDWMRGTETVVPDQAVTTDQLIVGGRAFQILRLFGHTEGDLAIFDPTTGVLFAGDLVFHDRTPTTPSADIAQWLAALDQLQALPIKVLVPGHGPVSDGSGPIDQTRGYLRWLDGALRRSVAGGQDMVEAMNQPIPAPWDRLALAREEFVRSVSNLYPDLELTLLPRVDAR